MSTIATSTHERLEHIWSDAPGLPGFLTTVDHKRIGVRYLVTVVVFLMLAGLQALVMRAQLAAPGQDLVSPEVYNQLMTMHGTTMLFLMNTPVWAGFGNYFLPLQIGTRDMAFPRLNALSYWIFLFSGIFMYSSFFVGAIPDGGWFAYVPFTSVEFSPGVNLDFYALGVIFVGISTTVGAINFLVTTFKMRAPGMTVSRIPIFVWGIVVMSFMILFAVPSITLSQVLLEIDRIFGFSFYDPGAGGEPLLYQHLFWIWGHPEVYIVFIPAMGLISMVIQTFSRTRLAAYLLAVTALVAIGFISFGVWAHHMFATGLGLLALSFFSAASFLVAIPSGVQFASWIATLWKGRPRFTTPMLWALGTMVIFLLGGVTGVMFAVIPFDHVAHDSYFVVAHFHYTLNGGSVFPIFAGLYYWMPKMTGRMYHEGVGRWSFWLSFIGFNVAFFPMHILGLLGMPRRVYTFADGLGWNSYNLVSTLGAFLLGFGFLLAVGNFVWCRFRGEPVGANPWGADSLEWATSSPPDDYNFLQIPTVTSLNPLWDQVHREGAEDEPRHEDASAVLLPPEGEEEHYTLATGGLDAAREKVMPMPEPSYWPFVVAVAATVFFYALLIENFWMGVLGVGMLAVAVVGWLWPNWDPEEVHLADVGPGAGSHSGSGGGR